MKKAKHARRGMQLSRETIAHLVGGGLAEAQPAGDSQSDPTCQYTRDSMCPHELCPNCAGVGVVAPG